MKKIKYIPIIDEIAFFINYRAKKYLQTRIFKNKKIHKSVNIGYNCKIEENVYVDKYTYVGDNCQFFTGEKSYIKIGKCCAIGNNVHIKSRTHDLSQPTRTDTIKKNKRKESDINIGNYVWIGDNVFIKEGVIIQDHAVIAANSVVVKNVEKCEIVGGVPAKKISINKKLDLKKYEGKS